MSVASPVSRRKGPSRTPPRKVHYEGRYKGHYFRKVSSRWIGPPSKRKLRAVFLCDGCGATVVEGFRVPKDECDVCVVKDVLLS